MREWKRKFQLDTWELLMAYIYRDGLEFKRTNLRDLCNKTGLTRAYFGSRLISGRPKFYPDCDTMHQILIKLDPVLDSKLTYHPQNIWAKKLLARNGGEMLSSPAGIEE